MKYAIYPYLDKFALLVDYIIKQKKYNITTLIKPKVWDAVDPGYDNVLMTSSFNDAVENVDAVIFLDDVHYSDCIRKIARCIKMKTDVVCCVSVKNDDYSYLTELAKQYGVKITLCDGKDHEIINKFAGRILRYHTQECVVAAVGSIFNGGAGYDSEFVLKLAKSFKSKGYAVTVLGSDRNFDLCGFHPSLPFDFSDLDENPDVFVLKLNAYYNYIQMIEKPDVIILQLPQEGLAKMFDSLPYGFGIRSFIISQAIDVNYFSLVWGVEKSTDENFRNISVMFEKRFGFKVDSVAISDCYVDYHESLSKGKVICMQVDEDDVKDTLEFIKESDECENSDILYCRYSDASIGDIISENCIEKLSS